MQFVFRLFLLIILLITYDVSAQNVDEPADDLLNEINIDDRRICALFMDHPSPGDQEVIVSVSVNSRSLNLSSLMFNEIINNRQALIASRQSYVQVIRSLIASEKIDWIGVALSPEELQNRPVDVQIESYSKNRATTLYYI